jgi:cytochrome c-type biogenesis protein CcmH/NrfF
MSLILGSHFLAGAILSWALPIGVLVVVGLYWALLLRRRAAGARTGKVE